MPQGPANIPPYQPRGIDPTLLMLLMQQQQQQAQQPQQQGGGGMVDLAKGLAATKGGKNVFQTLGGLFKGGSTETAATYAGMEHPVVATPNLVGANLIEGGASPVTGLGGIAAYIPPALAVAYGANAVADFAKGEKLSTPQKLAMALPTVGLSLFSDTLQKKFGLVSDRFKDEQKRVEKLREKGVNVPDSLYNPLSKGRSKDELVRIEEEKIAKGQYGNPEFARTRDPSLLKPEDTWGYSAWMEKYGNDYLGKWSEDQRRKANQFALDKGLIKEHHGTIDIKNSAEMDAYIEDLLNGKPSTPQIKEQPKPQGGMTKLTPEQTRQAQDKFNVGDMANQIKTSPNEVDKAISFIKGLSRRR